MKDSGSIFKLPSNWKKEEHDLVPTKETTTVTRVTPQNNGARDNLDHASYIRLCTLERRRQELEIAKTEEELYSRALNAAHDKHDLMNLEAVFSGESGAVPKRRK